MFIPPFKAINNKWGGFSLLELSIAMSLSGMLTLMLMTLYSSFMRSAWEMSQTAEQLENGRYACYFLRSLFNNTLTIRGLAKNRLEYQQLKIKPSTDAFAIQSTIKKQSSSSIFISDGNYTNDPAKKFFSLYFKEIGKPRIEIAHGLTNMQIIYGIKCPSSLNICRYVPQTQVTDWEQVRAMRILLTSDMNRLLKQWSLYVAIKKDQ